MSLKTPEVWIKELAKISIFSEFDFMNSGANLIIVQIQSYAMAEQRERDARIIENTDNPYLPDFEKPGLAKEIREQK